MVAAADHSHQPLFSRWHSPTDWPWVISAVVGEARRILSYHQHLTEEQRPPKSIWHSRKQCAAWIDEHMPGKSNSSRILFNDNEVER